METLIELKKSIKKENTLSPELLKKIDACISCSRW